MAVERARHHLAAGMPAGHPGVVVAQLVQGERQIPVGRPPHLVQLPRFAVRVEHLAEHLHARPVAQQLPRREQVAPLLDAVDLGPVAVHVVIALVRHEVEGVPFRQLLVERRPQRRAVVVLRPGRAVAADPLLAGAAGLRPDGLPPLADHREELLAHLPGLRLRLDRIAVDDPAAVRERARPVAARHRARRLLPRRADDLEPAHPAAGARPAAGAGDETDAGSVRGETPVRGEGDEAVAVGAGDGARPEVPVRPGIVFGFLREGAGKTPADFRRERPPDFFDLLRQADAMPDGPVQRGPFYQRRDRVQVVGLRDASETNRLERNASPAGGRIENGNRVDAVLRQPLPVPIRRRVAERPRVSVGIGAKAFSGPIRRRDPPLRGQRVPVDADHVQEPVAVRVLRQQRRQDRRARRHQRTARPPDVEVVRGRQRRHRTALAGGFFADLGDRQPAFDQAGVGHGWILVWPIATDDR